MLIDVIMPKMGESIMDGTILKWHKQVGENIGKDETLFEISTDKVDTEVPASDAGVIAELLYKEGDVVNVGEVVARIETDTSKKISPATEKEEKPKAETSTGTKEEKPKAETKAEVKEEKPKEEIKTEKKETVQADDSGSSFYSPLVLNIASKEGISMDELSKIKGTGIGGRVRKQDVLSYIENRGEQKEKKAETPGAQAKPEQVKKEEPAKASKTEKQAAPVTIEQEIETRQMDTLQEKMAEHMVMSVQTSPHVGAIAECDMSAVEKAKAELEADFLKREGFKLTYMPFIGEAVVKALQDFPLVNSSIEGKKILLKKHINLGFAVAMDNGGLIVPVIKNADSKNLVGIARDVNDLAKRARIKKLTLEEIEGGTFTITNYGIFGNDIGTPIINQPNLAILGIGAVKKRPVVIETEHGDSIAIKPMCYLTLSFDHRIIDGALGGKFLMRIVQYLEEYS